jgi:uncharacterized protein (AIM24 family)
MQSDVIGTTMPVVEFILQPNEAIISEAGELSWVGASIQMTRHTQMAGGGGFFGAIRRVAGGGTLFMTEYRASGAAGEQAFAIKVPGPFADLPVRGRSHVSETVPPPKSRSPVGILHHVKRPDIRPLVHR